jgi:Fur family peroxide stress response transcriptional regulator
MYAGPTGEAVMERLTPQRAAIMEYLDGNTSHPSADDIYRAVRKRLPMISLATVYNTLEVLAREGTVQKLDIDPARKRYDPDTSLHHHLICTACGSVVDVRGDYRLHVPPRQRAGYRIDRSHVDFYGVCPRCRDRGEDRRRSPNRRTGRER